MSPIKACCTRTAPARSASSMATPPSRFSPEVPAVGSLGGESTALVCDRSPGHAHLPVGTQVRYADRLRQGRGPCAGGAEEGGALSACPRKALLVGVLRPGTQGAEGSAMACGARGEDVNPAEPS